EAGAHGHHRAPLARRALASAREPHSPVRVSGPDGRIELVLHLREWTTFDADLSADAVYYDPFGPKAEPESWTVECFEMAREQIADDALLGTYSAASDVKRAMAEAGFAVATAPGTGRKREVTFASPSPEALEPYELLDVD
ncbi:MAG: MnmC family methyltransferase, partial [Bradymonadaceae bacterium]